MKAAQADNIFWRSAAITAATLAALAALAWLGPTLEGTGWGKRPADLIAVSRSRSIFFNAGLTGYYERLYQKTPVMRHTRIFDSFRILRLRPNADETINRFGFVGPEYSLEKPAHTRRIVVLGDSLTQGIAVKINQLYVARLEERLNAVHAGGPGERFEVMNFGIGGYKIAEITDVALADAHRFQPDVYMLALTELSVFVNWDVHLADLIQKGLDPKYDFLREVIRESGAKKTDDTLTLYAKLAPYRVEVLRWGLETLKALAERDHAQFVVLLMPSVQDGNLSRRRFIGIRELVASVGVPSIDLLNTFASIPDPERFRINPFDVHANADGHAMVFDNLYAQLRARPDLWKAVTGTDR